MDSSHVSMAVRASLAALAGTALALYAPPSLGQSAAAP